MLAGALVGSAAPFFSQTQGEKEAAPAPLFRDPIYDGAADPVVIWHRQEKCWWMLYTQRRANVDGPGVAWVHGCDIGVARSMDGGRIWRYLGVLPGLEFERGRNTFWAPEVMWHQGTYHMYSSYVPGVPQDWNDARRIVHYSSADMWNWKCHGPLKLSSDKLIDACVVRMPAGQWRMWFKDESPLIAHMGGGQPEPLRVEGRGADRHRSRARGAERLSLAQCLVVDHGPLGRAGRIPFD